MHHTIRVMFAISALALAVTFIAAPHSAVGQEMVTVHLFWREGCMYCEREMAYFETLQARDQSLELKKYEVLNNKSNQELFKKINTTYNLNIRSVPITIIGDQVISGFSQPATPQQIESAIEQCRSNQCPDLVAAVLDDTEKNTNTNEQPSGPITIPVLGTINPQTFSLPLLTVFLGILDGFNPCAMWVLLFLISMLLGMENKKRMWALGATFIVASAAVYYLFMAAWLNLLLLLGFVFWIRVLIALLALGGGGYNIWKYFGTDESGCTIVGSERRRRIFDRFRRVLQKEHFWLALAGVAFIAFGVNLIELLCSAGFPVVYTQVLTLNNLPTWQYYLYLALYVFVFMLDDLFIFFVAMLTLQMAGITTKYSRFSHLIGGLAMVLIGILLLLKPEWLSFG